MNRCSGRCSWLRPRPWPSGSNAKRRPGRPHCAYRGARPTRPTCRSLSRRPYGRTDVQMRLAIQMAVFWLAGLAISVSHGIAAVAGAYTVFSFAFFMWSLYVCLPLIRCSFADYVRALVWPVVLSLAGILGYVVAGKGMGRLISCEHSDCGGSNPRRHCRRRFHSKRQIESGPVLFPSQTIKRRR
jgi:hypothetical protein